MNRRFPFTRCNQAATRLTNHLESACERVAICGSLRRLRHAKYRSEMVSLTARERFQFERIWTNGRLKDIEVLAVPKLVDRTDRLFCSGEKVSLLDIRLADLLINDEVPLNRDLIGNKWGPKWKKMIFEDIPVDLFIADRDAFGWQSVLRTGPQEFSQLMVTSQPDGGARPLKLTCSEGRLIHQGEAIVTSEEGHVFSAFGIPFIPPEERTATKLRNILKSPNPVNSL